MSATTVARALKRMLVVDDEEGPRQSLNMIFCDDFDVTVASSGEEAIRVSEENPFDVVITDIRMRGLSGIDVLREVKKIHKHTEVIVLTAFETLETARQAISLGASEYLKKPFDLDHIQRVVERCHRNYLFTTQHEALIRRDVNAAKTNFLGIVSHELNTPMHGIVGFIELLEETELDAEQRDFLNTIRDCSLKYFEHVQDILAYAKLTMGGGDEVSSEGFNPATLALKLFNEHSAVGELAVRAEIPDNLPQYVTGPEHEIRIILRKLLQNALKFTEEGSVEVSVRFERIPGSQVKLQFAVRDTGPGIEPEFMKSGRMYDPFSQGDSSAKRAHGGLGLGLALVRSFTDRIGGELSVESEQGKGSTFRFSIVVREEDS